MKLIHFTPAISLLAASLFAASGSMHAQGTTTVATPPTSVKAGHETIGERQENQQDRIAKGIKSGELTASESATLEKQEAGIEKEKVGMRAEDNGKLTTQDKALLNSQLNTESKEIETDKHNDSTQPAAKGEVNKRAENQQDRIAAGLKGGELTTVQTAHLEKQEAGIQTEESGMRAQDNGKLSAQDKKVLNSQLNKESRRISRDERRTTRKK